MHHLLLVDYWEDKTMALLDEEGAAFGYYQQLQRQAARIRNTAQGRTAENLPDPRTYGFVSGLLGISPDELGMSVLSPNTQAAKEAAYYGYQLGNASQIAPSVTPLAKALGRGLLTLSPSEAIAMSNPMSQIGGVTTSLKKNITKKDATVMRPQRVAYPDIYKNPADLVAEAASRVAPEDPLLKQLFGVTRDDLWAISQQGTRQGNITDRPFNAAANAKGATHAGEVTNPRNTKRLQNIIEEAQNYPDLYKGMGSWYTMDPLFDRFVQLYGPDRAIQEYNKFNVLTGMASPGSEVLTEFNRGTGANWLATQNRFGDFQKYGGLAEFRRGTEFPEDMRAIIGHPYHSTAHSGPMSKYIETGLLDMGSAKVPSYIHASGVPQVGFQTQWPVGDAHWSRLVGLPDVRGATTKKGVASIPNASASVPEMTALGPWWANEVAAPMGIEAVPAQAIVWGAGSGATGVTSPIGAPKLELLSQQIGKAAQRMGVTPEVARDMIIQGKAHAGFVDPSLAGYLGGVTGAGLLGYDYFQGE
jgi:hypothetical protein